MSFDRPFFGAAIFVPVFIFSMIVAVAMPFHLAWYCVVSLIALLLALWFRLSNRW